MGTQASASQAEILESLERASGVTLRTRVAVSAYVAAIGTGGTSTLTTLTDRRGWVIARHSALAAGLAIATLQYYFMGVYVQIASLRSITALEITPPAKRS